MSKKETESINFIDTVSTISKIIFEIKNNKPGIYLRFGDGDFNLAENKNDMLAKANPRLQELMLQVINIRDDKVMIGLPHHCKEIGTLEKGMFPGNHENIYSSIKNFVNKLGSKVSKPDKIYSSVALSQCSTNNPEKVIEIHKEIQKKQVLFIGNKLYSDEYINKLFGNNVLRINTNHVNSFDNFDEVINLFDNYYKDNKNNKNNYFVLVIAAGCASRAISGYLYHKYFVSNPNFFIFDYGSLLDYLYGFNTRAYMDLAPPQKKYILENI